ncbi:amino acid/amide ABC transporter substrate-binding protein, HAAT family [Quadrisphaera granulorum]|uniref:Amino acid/amide ABC transporter substrate-binding protein (HAAT family) n=2 Tax=Quadrisphaera granulorum TaxID=317664 RepID=A0A315ZY72_9ACTN|nr:amino acid/amide ABC transporter substrate-binding protein (HAAT family) [Quadrisphaera granulorum]SZE97874.1 amino acid/amide ABC transporter substrate-binding protein, HAAT family [Quadrisphaera granulorum]
MSRLVALGAVAALALSACASNTDSSSSSSGSKELIISTDLPLQGSSATQSGDTNKLIQLYLDQIGGKVGDYTVKLKTYDNSTAAKGAWDDAACAKNATDHVADAAEVAVMGTFNSGCAKIEVPTLNQDSTGPLLMVSHAATNPGLTKEWETGEPAKYYPTGNRNFARVVTTDDYQGNAAAAYAKGDLQVTKCYVLNDNQTYGLGVAKAFATAAAKEGIEVVGEAAWDAKQPNYTALFQTVKASGADCVYLGGIYDNNGGQLIKDKVAVLGDNAGVKLMAPDGFTGYADLLALPESEGMYLSFAGLTTDQLTAAGGPAAKLIDAFTQKYGQAPSGSYPLYGVAATQVILAAIEKSDGTRKGVNDAIFSGEGVTIPAADSVTGKEIKIDPKTGDTDARDVTIELVTGGKETFAKAQSVEG